MDKDLGHWTIPKGEIEQGEEPVAVARREFAEETGSELPDTPLVELGEIRQKSGKLVLAWAARGDLDTATAVSNSETVRNVNGSVAVTPNRRLEPARPRNKAPTSPIRIVASSMVEDEGVLSKFDAFGAIVLHSCR